MTFFNYRLALRDALNNYVGDRVTNIKYIVPFLEEMTVEQQTALDGTVIEDYDPHRFGMQLQQALQMVRRRNPELVKGSITASIHWGEAAGIVLLDE